MGDRLSYVGLDVHKEAIVVAIAEGGLRGEIREYGRIANTRRHWIEWRASSAVTG